MRKILAAFLYAFITTALVAVSFTSAQNLFNQEEVGFVGSVSVKVYCTFSPVFGGDSSACNSDIEVTDDTNDGSVISNDGSTNTLSESKSNQISQIINRTLSNNGNPTRVAYIQGPAGPAGRDGTTTVVYETRIAGQVVSPSAYVNPGPSNHPAYQTTVPGDIWETMIHRLGFDQATGNNLNSTNINATNTFTVNLTATNFNLGTGTIGTTSITSANIQNLWANNATTLNSSSTNFFSSFASITEATTTNIYSLIANFIELFATNATITNATSSNLFSTNASITNATATNLFANYASVTSATTTNLFATRASITEATTTYFFAAFANFLNLFVNNLGFNSATGTNLQVGNASTTNLVATGTTNLTNAFIASSTQFNSSINSGNATLTNTFVNFASITNATTTNLFAVLLNALTATFTNLLATNASITNATTTNIFATNAKLLNASSTYFVATNATLTNATITNLRVVNCAEGNVICNGGNDTGAVVGPDPVLTIGTLNAGNIEFITGDTGFPSVTPGAAKLIIETGVAGDGNGDVRVIQTLKVGENIVASGTITSTNLVATGTFTFATGTMGSSTINWLTAVRAMLTNATITNSTSTKIFATSASITNATTTNLFSANASLTNATTTYFFAAMANFLNLFVNSLTFNSATGTNLQVANASTTNFSATGTSVITNLFGGLATFTAATSTNLFATNLNSVGGNVNLGTTTMYGSLIPNASTTYHTLGTAILPWAELYVSSSSVYIGNIKLSNVNGVLSWGGTGVSFASSTPTSTSTFGLINASTTNSENLLTTNATLTNLVSVNATATNLFATVGSFVTGMFTNLLATNATVSNAFANSLTAGTFTATGTSLLGNLTAGTTTLGSATLGNTNLLDLVGLKATLTNIYSPSITGSSVNVGTVITNLLTGVNTIANELFFINATGTKLTAQNIFVTNLTATGTSKFTILQASTTLLTNATTTTLFANTASVTTLFVNCTNGNVLCKNSTYAADLLIGSTGNSNTLDLTTNGTNADLTINTQGGGSDIVLETDVTSSNIVFTIAGTERLRVDGISNDVVIDDDVTVGDDATITGDLTVDATTLYVDAADERVGINTNNPTTGGNVRLDVDGDIRVGTASTNGCIQNNNGTAIAGTCSSDESLKTEIVEVESMTLLEKISKIKFVTYKWNEIAKNVYGIGGDTKVFGVTAQNVESVFPELVVTDSFGYKQVNLTDLQWYILASVKEINSKIDSINEEILSASEIVVNTLKAKNIETDKVVTKEFCVGTECFTEADMKEFRNYLNSKKVVDDTSTPAATTPVSTDTTSTTTEPVATTTEILVEPEVSPEILTETVVLPAETEATE